MNTARGMNGDCGVGAGGDGSNRINAGNGICTCVDAGVGVQFDATHAWRNNRGRMNKAHDGVDGSGALHHFIYSKHLIELAYYQSDHNIQQTICYLVLHLRRDTPAEFATQFIRNRLYNNDATYYGSGGYFDCMNEFIFNNVIAENNSASVGNGNSNGESNLYANFRNRYYSGYILLKLTVKIKMKLIVLILVHLVIVIIYGKILLNQQ